MTDVVTPEIKAKKPHMNEVTQAEFDRDMWRLKSLRDKFTNPGLNTYEDNEVNQLLEKYDIERVGNWSRREMFK